jgi:dipeptidase E
MIKQIIGLGGGGFTMEPNNPLLDLYILAAANKERPKICFLPTASADNEHLIGFFHQVFDSYPCEPTYLTVFNPNVPDMEELLLSSDIIYVGGGNTKSMLGLWRTWGIDKILKKAYDKGIILAGVSAGFVCWFEECITDSIPGKFTTMSCLGLLPGSGCPHYDGQPGRPEAYHALLAGGEVSNGYAVDDGVGLHFIDGKLHKVISSRNNANAYHVYREMSGKTEQERLKPEYLGSEANFQKYIMSTLFKDSVLEQESEEEVTEIIELNSSELEEDVSENSL